jgi:nitrite reductase/ring-hydroxylating ferredoxin subunit/DMSO/TMAO reductase YedYZ heme-binding membrane subunit
MSARYVAVGWTPHKRRYDAAAVIGVLGFLLAWFVVGKMVWRGENAVSDEVLLLRGLGACALVMLHAVLAIGPLARLDRRLLPVLANRRHLGVLTFLLALAHAAVAIGYYHGFGVISPLRSLLVSSGPLWPLGGFPFEWLGALALAILFLLAATSHDFWLKNLGPRAWKRLHMLVYAAYVLLIGHLALGVLQTSRAGLYTLLVGAGAAALSVLHIASALREARADAGQEPAPGPEAWIDAGPIEDIPMDRARIVAAKGGERIAVFRHAAGVSAVTNVCAHQGGPLGEGRVIDGCITCPWHGWQYRPGDGCSPPPFTERIATYPVRITAGRVEVSSVPRSPAPSAAPEQQEPPHA